MNVATMISLMKTLGIGESNNDDDYDNIALQFLNLAHDELYRETAQLNDNNFLSEDLKNVADSPIVSLSYKPFIISKVFSVDFQRILIKKSFTEFNTYKFEKQYSTDPSIYINILNHINFYPISAGVQYNFNVLYIPERKSFQLNTEESQIPYPLSYHGVLVDGALYYLFQDESGFKNPTKENEALRRWLKGKSDLISYLYGSNSQTISTYSNT